MCQQFVSEIVDCRTKGHQVSPDKIRSCDPSAGGLQRRPQSAPFYITDPLRWCLPGELGGFWSDELPSLLSLPPPPRAPSLTPLSHIANIISQSNCWQTPVSPRLIPRVAADIRGRERHGSVQGEEATGQ